MAAQSINAWEIRDDKDNKTVDNKGERAKKMLLSIFPYDEFNVASNNIAFCKQCFTFMRDFCLLNEENVAFLQNYDKCSSKKIGGLVDKGMGLSVLKEVKGLPNEREVAGHIRYNAETFLVCKGHKYYISNNWFIKDKDDSRGKWGLVKWILELAGFSDDEMEYFQDFYGMLHTINKGETKDLIDMLRWISQEMTAGIVKKAKHS